jgi:hypothetical protein
MNKVSCSSFLSPWIASSDVPEPDDYEHMDFESFIANG